MVRFHSGIGVTPFEKLSQYGKFSKKIALFPVMVLDEIIESLNVFFLRISRVDTMS